MEATHFGEGGPSLTTMCTGWFSDAHIGFTFSRRSHTQSHGLVHLHIYLKIIFSDVATSISSLLHKSFGFISSLRTWSPAWMGRKVHTPSLLQHCRHEAYSPIALQRNPDAIWVKKHFFQSHHSNCSKFFIQIYRYCITHKFNSWALHSGHETGCKHI